jgi:hypothetical protein
MSDLAVLGGSAAGLAGAMLAAWYVCNVVLPRLEAAFSGRPAFSRDAERRARDLFFSKLDARQRSSWRLRRRFDARAKSGRLYTISRYNPFNIRTDDAVFCLRVAGATPAYDKLLAQKLLIEADEELFLAKANVRTFSLAWEPRMRLARNDCRARGLIADITS